MEDSTKGRINLHDSFFNIPYSFFISPQGLCSFESLLRKQSLKRQIERLFSFCPKTVRRFAVCGKRIQMVSDDPPPALRHWAGGFRFMAPLLFPMEDSTKGRINLHSSFFNIQYSFFISPPGRVFSARLAPLRSFGKWRMMKAETHQGGIPMQQQTLFQNPGDAPLAARLRPRTLDEMVGQQHLLGPGKVLRRLIESDRISSMIFWVNFPGWGKPPWPGSSPTTPKPPSSTFPPSPAASRRSEG